MTGYGQDVWCLDSMVTGRVARGVNVVAQACYRRLVTPRGTLRGGADEQNYGLDLAGLVGSLSTGDLVAQLPSRIRGELLKDDRVADVTAEVTATQEGGGRTSLVIRILVTLADEDDEFTLTLGVNDVTVELLGLG